MIIAHSRFPPAIFTSPTTGIRYMICDGKYIEVPLDTSWNDITWFRRPSKGQEAKVLKTQREWNAPGSKGKEYIVKVNDDRWSCSCPAFGWSGNSRKCKHIDKIKKEELGV